jgi:hypothetical protein
MTGAAAELAPAARSAVAARYETLRGSALGQALPPESRSGLMLFLSHGMWGWARTLAVPSVIAEPKPTSSPDAPVPSARKAVVRVLAALAITPTDRRAL